MPGRAKIPENPSAATAINRVAHLLANPPVEWPVRHDHCASRSSFAASDPMMMAAKRVSEHRAIVEAGGTANLAAYRPSFAVYTHSSLVTSCLVYAQGFAFMMAIFLLKYRIEYLVVIPLFIALFAAYMR